MIRGRGLSVGTEVSLKRTPGGEILSGAGSGMTAAIRTVMEKAGAAAAENAKRLVPVKTGRLRDSIGWAVITRPDGSFETAVGTDVPYAAAQELGTSRMPGKHFLEDGTAAGAADVFGGA